MPPVHPSTEPLYAVRKRTRDEYNRDEIPEPADQYEAAFPTRAEAEQYAHQRNRQELLEKLPIADLIDWTPFERGWDRATSLPEYAFRDWLQEADIPVPELPERPPELRPDHRMSDQKWAKFETDARREHVIRPWRNWWLEVVAKDTLSQEQILHIWEGLNKYELYEVELLPTADRPIAAGEVVYAVVHQHWEYDDCWYGGRNEAVRAFRTRADAEAECARRERSQQPTDDYWNGGPYRFVVVEMLLESDS